MDDTWEHLFDAFCPPRDPPDLSLSSGGSEGEPSAAPMTAGGSETSPSRRASVSRAAPPAAAGPERHQQVQQQLAFRGPPEPRDTALAATIEEAMGGMAGGVDVTGPAAMDEDVRRRPPPAPRPRHAVLPARRPRFAELAAQVPAVEAPAQRPGVAPASSPGPDGGDGAGRPSTPGPPAGPAPSEVSVPSPSPPRPSTPHPLDLPRPPSPSLYCGSFISPFGHTSYVAFYHFMTHPLVRAAWRELHDDWLWDGFSESSPRNDGRDGPDDDAVYWRVKLCEWEPEVWCYNDPCPDKRTWLADAHHARFSVRVQVVRREMEGLGRGPLEDAVRMRHVEADNRLALFLLKVESARGERRGVEVDEVVV